MPTTIRTAAVARRWVGRGNGPSRVTGASACPAAGLGDCYKNNYPHRALGAARINTAHRRFHTAQRMTRRRINFTYQIRIHSAKGGQGRYRTRKPSVSIALQTFQHVQVHAWPDKLLHEIGCRRYGSLWHIGTSAIQWTAGRTRRARRSPTVDDSQRGPTDSGTNITEKP
jgi:hypothetical protein